MSCDINALKQVPFFGLLDDEELTVLASQVEQKTFGARQRIYKIGETSLRAYIIVSGVVRVTTIDEDNQEVVVDQPGAGEFFGFASMLAQTPHQTQAFTTEETTDRKSTRLNSSHGYISYAVFCLKKKNNIKQRAHAYHI